MDPESITIDDILAEMKHFPSYEAAIKLFLHQTMTRPTSWEEQEEARHTLQCMRRMLAHYMPPRKATER